MKGYFWASVICSACGTALYIANRREKQPDSPTDEQLLWHPLNSCDQAGELFELPAIELTKIS